MQGLRAVCSALTPVLQDIAKGLCSAVGHEHALFWRFSICDNLCVLAAAFHNRELEQPGKRPLGALFAGRMWANSSHEEAAASHRQGTQIEGCC